MLTLAHVGNLDYDYRNDIPRTPGDNGGIKDLAKDLQATNCACSFRQYLRTMTKLLNIGPC